jgi:hypothetical protein
VSEDPPDLLAALQASVDRARATRPAVVPAPKPDPYDVDVRPTVRARFGGWCGLCKLRYRMGEWIGGTSEYGWICPACLQETTRKRA